MMRSWGNRTDTFVCDEPLYAHYLLQTGLDHPGADEIIGRYEGDWRKVVAWLTGDVPEGKNIFFQKHMAHHLLPNIERDWLDRLSNIFLIRDPGEMLTSLAKILPQPTLKDTGLPQQVDIFNWIRRRSGQTPPVLDSKDVLRNPRDSMRRLCHALDIEVTDAMFSWPAGSRPTDGIWGKYWYQAVERSTSFQPYVPKSDPIPPVVHGILGKCQDLYDQLYSHRLGP